MWIKDSYKIPILDLGIDRFERRLTSFLVESNLKLRGERISYGIPILNYVVTEIEAGRQPPSKFLFK
jgi:hypothetical protein